jgi:hypothetical protein
LIADRTQEERRKLKSGSIHSGGGETRVRHPLWGHAQTNEDIVDAAKTEIAKLRGR